MPNIAAKNTRDDEFRDNKAADDEGETPQASDKKHFPCCTHVQQGKFALQKELPPP